MLAELSSRIKTFGLLLRMKMSLSSARAAGGLLTGGTPSERSETHSTRTSAFFVCSIAYLIAL
jgi:hypothetical protein